MIFIGITGGIGSGKSYICSLFAEKKIPIFHADEAAKEISEQSDVRKEIVSVFGNSILTTDKTIDRKKLASIVFSEHKKLLLLNSIIHPRVFAEFESWKKSLHQRNHYAVAEAALMFESGMDEKVDYVLSVIADDEIRIKRVVERDHSSDDMVISRMTNQLPTQELIERSDFVINNNGTKEEAASKVSFFHTLFSTLTQRKEIQ
ncbi:MAG: dephospho-CoA kinase [Bacteroidota bacterium]